MEFASTSLHCKDEVTYVDTKMNIEDARALVTTPGKGLDDGIKLSLRCDSTALRGGPRSCSKISKAVWLCMVLTSVDVKRSPILSSSVQNEYRYDIKSTCGHKICSDIRTETETWWITKI